jgi:DNA-binding CsgD family transcriptional regulator
VEVAALDIASPETQMGVESRSELEGGKDQVGGPTVSQEFEIYPEDPAIRKRWFSLTIREREVVALLCMGYRNYEIAPILRIGYQTVLTHVQNIFYKFELRSRKEIRAALRSWPAEEWWRYHHY